MDQGTSCGSLCGWIGEGRATFQLDSDRAGLTREQIGIGRRTKALGRRVEPPERALSPLRSGMLLGFGWVWGKDRSPGLFALCSFWRQLGWAEQASRSPNARGGMR